MVVMIASCRDVESFVVIIAGIRKVKSVSGDHCKLQERQGEDSIGPHLPHL